MFEPASPTANPISNQFSWGQSLGFVLWITTQYGSNPGEILKETSMYLLVVFVCIALRLVTRGRSSEAQGRIQDFS